MTRPSNELAARAISPLLALNFFMADMQSGIGPFLGVFLLAHGWTSRPIGTVMTAGGIAGMLINAGLLSSRQWRDASALRACGGCDQAGRPVQFIATTIVVAQGVMMLVALIATRIGEKDGYWILLLIAFIALPIRGVIAAFVINKWGVYPVQILDGVGAGLQSVVVPGLVARILHGSGRVNAGQGAVMTIRVLAHR